MKSNEKTIENYKEDIIDDKVIYDSIENDINRYNDNSIKNKKLDYYLKSIADGDKDALTFLYDETKTQLYALIYSILKNKEDSEDILQDTYIKVYTFANKYNSMQKPMAWLYTIARNLCYMKIRATKNIADISTEEIELYQVDQRDLYKEKEDNIVINMFLDELSYEENQIISLHAISGYKHKEISEIMGIGLSTVISKYNRAIKKLRNKMEGKGIYE